MIELCQCQPLCSSRWTFNDYARVVEVVLLVLMGGAIVAATACLLKDCLYELGTQQTMQERGFG